MSGYELDPIQLIRAFKQAKEKCVDKWAPSVYNKKMETKCSKHGEKLQVLWEGSNPNCESCLYEHFHFADEGLEDEHD